MEKMPNARSSVVLTERVVFAISLLVVIGSARRISPTVAFFEGYIVDTAT
jgi:hypothetical protein